ncbi:MAG: phosphotransferase [Acidimicrobiales bacterium]
MRRGRSPQPAPWTREAIGQIGHTLRRLHDIAASFDPGPDPRWRASFARDLPEARPVLGHGDLGPWNIIAREGMTVAFIDWDNAGPVDALWELAQAGWLNAQLHDDDVAERNNLGSPAERIAQLVTFLDGYGLERAARPALVDMMIEFAIRSAREEAVVGRIGPDTPSPDLEGFPVLWAITWRTRAAAWMLDHRSQLLAALGA